MALGLTAVGTMGQAAEVGAAKPAPAKADATVVLMLSPKAAERPAMRYRLMPIVGEQIPGNAATLYLMALLQMSKGNVKDTDAKSLDTLLDCPMVDFDREAAGKLLEGYSGCLRTVELAALRESCDWGLPIRQEGTRTLLPHLNVIRELSKIVRLRVRLDVADRKYESAAHWLGVGYMIARHLNAQAVLIQGLVSAGVVGQMNKAMSDFSQAPDAPNLAWPLVSLPRPSQELGRMLEWERSWLYVTFPTLREIRSNPMTPEQWQKLVSEMMGIVDVNNRGENDNPLARGVKAATWGIMNHGVAKDYLVRHGYTQKQVDAMPPTQAIGIYYVDSYEGWGDELNKWTAVPYWQARPEIARVEEAFQKEANSRNLFLMALPAVAKCFERMASLDRDLAALCTIECIRGYAGEHGGKLPATLGELKDPPPPVDPFTGRLLDWKLGGEMGVLSAPVMPDDRKRVVRFEIRMRAGEK